MGFADGRKADLFDTSSRSGQTDLFDNRKRKAAAMQSPERGRYDRYEPPQFQPQEKHYYPASLDLGAMLYPDRITKDKYHKVQTVLKDQDKRIKALIKDLDAREQMCADRGRETSKRCNQINSLKQRAESLERENDRLREEKRRSAAASENSWKQLREKKEYLQGQLKEKDEFLTAGGKVVKDQAEKLQRLESENVRLRQTVTERDTMVSKLNEQIWKVTSASPDEQTQIRLEVQAQTTLNMVNGLKRDVSTRDERIEELERQIGEKDRVRRGEIQAKTDLQREVEGVKRELARQREVAEAATTRAKEAREAAADQEKLIGRIMEENGRLAGVDYVA